MWTLNYKGWWIHGYCDRDEVRVRAPNITGVSRTFKSLLAAKQFITRTGA